MTGPAAATMDSIPNEILREIVGYVVSGEDESAMKLKTLDNIGKVSTRLRGIASASDPYVKRDEMNCCVINPSFTIEGSSGGASRFACEAG